MKSNTIKSLSTFTTISILLILAYLLITTFAFSQTCTDSDGDFYYNIASEGCEPIDCDDNDANVYPGAKPFRITRVPSENFYFSTFQEAYDAALDGDIIQSRNSTSAEDITIHSNKSVSIEGGYNCSYTIISDTTTINGNLTISNGTFTVVTGTVQINQHDIIPRVVTSITRLSHPAFNIDNIYGQGGFNSWNSNLKRILMYESVGYCDPIAGCGRGIVTGNINELKSAAAIGTLQDYLNASTDIPDSIWENPKAIEWSPFSVENEYIYGLRASDKMLVKYNTDTGDQIPLISYSHPDLTATPSLLGWTSDNKLIVNFNQSEWDSGLYEVDIDFPDHVNPSTTHYSSRPNLCSERFSRYPSARSIHEGKSPDSKYYAHYNASSAESGVETNDYSDPLNCGLFYNDALNGSVTDDYLSHIDWQHSNDWFVGGKVLCQQTYPYLFNYAISQVFFNRGTNAFSHNKLISKLGAGYWKGSDCQDSQFEDYNYLALPSPTLSKDGKQLMFISTDGKYSTEDYNCCIKGCPDTTIPQSVCDAIVGNTGTRGIFIADISFSQCNNGLDDDKDGSIDMVDQDCDDIYDNSESVVSPPDNMFPELEIYTPDGIRSNIAVDSSFDITYNLTDVDNEVTSQFYYDVDNAGYDGIPINGCEQMTEGNGQTCTWNTAGLPSGIYYVYGTVNDSVNQTVNVYSHGPLRITNGDTLFDINHTSIASANPTTVETGIVMQRFEIFSDNADDGQVELISLDIFDNGTTSTILNAKIYISTLSSTTLPQDAVLIGNTGLWDGTLKTVTFSGGTTGDRTVSNGTSKYIYIVYDLAMGEQGSSIQSSVRTLNVAGNDIAPFYLGHSNSLTIQSCLPTGSVSILPGQTLSGQSIDLTSFMTKDNTINIYYEVRAFHSCEVDQNGTYIDAENYTGTISQGTSTFIDENNQPGYLGAGYLKSIGEGFQGACPPVSEGKEYRINFTAPGQYNVWIRSFALDNSSNSMFLGIDGNCVGSIRNDVYNQWAWTNDIQNGSTVINVASAGTHSLNIWVREPDHLIDGIYLTQGTETPTDLTLETIINPGDCSTPIFVGDETAAQSVDTSEWLQGDKDLTVTADDATCLSALPSGNDSFTFSFESDCTDNIDNDNDGYSDCADEDCNGISKCEYGTEISCFDNNDNDADTFTDCQDPDCNLVTNGTCSTGQSGICAPGTITCSGGLEVCIQDNQSQTEGPITDPTCIDVIDNDCDGLTDTDEECLCEIPLDNFTDGLIDTTLWENTTSGNTTGTGANTFFLEQNNRMEAQASRHLASSSAPVINVLQTTSVSQGDFFVENIVVQAQVYWYADTLTAGSPPDSITRVSIIDGFNEVILWTAPQESWTSGTDNGLRTDANQRDNLMQFEFDATNQTVSFMEDGNFIGVFDISVLSAWQIKWYTEGHNYQNSHTATGQVFISLFQKVTVTGSTSILTGQALTGNPIDLTSITNSSYTTNLWYTVTEENLCDVDPTGTYVEAEHFSGTINPGSGTLSHEAFPSGFLGSGLLKSNGGTGTYCPPVDEGKEYEMNFIETGTYKVWLRAYASDFSSDSVFIGLDGNCVGALNGSEIYNQWTWTSNIKNGTNTVTVTTGGLHTINIWTREANHLVDGIYITTDEVTPTDSTHGIEINPNNCINELFSGNNTSAQNVDTTLWVSSEKELEISGDDDTCSIPLTPAHDTFNYVK